ncbi:XisI protein [Candidatus Magnetomorum sp. HK-1]|nr:XisI protein [Candidatus Magnetomorum sp. HK-1]
MDKLDHYRTCIQKIIQKYGKRSSTNRDAEIQIISDTKNDHYQVLKVGWKKDKRIHSCFIHIDIKNDKIWIQHNGTEARIASELIEFGIPKQDIVLAFYPPYKRKYTDYATS